MKRKSLMFCCATGLLIMPILFSSIIMTSTYFGNKVNNINLELVEYKQKTANTRQYENTYEIENLINYEKGRLIEENKRVEIDIEVSFYCSCELCCGIGARGITAFGTVASRGVIAIPQELSLGTKVLIPELAQYSANRDSIFLGYDRGGAIIMSNGVYKIDVWVSSHEEALKLGRFKTKAWIIKD